MAAGYKNLILIDNSMSVGNANFMLCKETAKYICENSKSGDLIRIASFGEDIEYITDYTSDSTLLEAGIEKLEMEDRDTYITDNLTQILTEWRDQDVACRNIILFTDGEESEPLMHDKEEMYYLMEQTDYPVYVVQCVDKKSDPAAKNLSAIATISNGRLLLTEFEGSEAESEKTIGNKILEAMSERSSSISEKTINSPVGTEGEEVSKDEGTDEETAEEKESTQGEEKETGGMETEDTDTENAELSGTSADNEASGEYSGQTQVLKGEFPMQSVYSMYDNSPIIRNSKSEGTIFTHGLFIPAVSVAGLLIFAAVIYIVFRRKRSVPRGDKDLYEDICRQMSSEGRIAEDAEDYDCTTHKFSEERGGTRILANTDGGRDIVLEDCNDPTRLFRASCINELIVGRSPRLCDVAIEYDDSISGRHCELSVREGCWYVRDLGSSNGTRVNNQKVFQELMLKCGDILQLGQSMLQVRI